MPSREALGKVLKNYVSDVGKVRWDKDRFFVILPGKPKFPFQHIYPRPRGCYHNERWFEVWLGKRCVDVITRQTDDFTNVVAAGYADIVARFWDGKREE